MTDLAGASVVFRTDASLQIGSGHVMRCLALAAALRGRGARSRFVGRAMSGDLFEAVSRAGHDLTVLPAPASRGKLAPGSPPHAAWLGADWPADAAQVLEALSGERPDWLVIDHYALDAGWESVLRPHVQRLLVIDDLADRPHACDLLLDQNLGRKAGDYAALVPIGCRVLAGPQFALLRPEFAALRAASLARRRAPVLKQLLITMGGVDARDATGAVLEALGNCDLPPLLRIKVVMGRSAPALAAVREKAARMRWPTQVLVDVADMAALMLEADLAIGAAGTTSWERCCLGLPSIVVALADNQRGIQCELQAAGAAIAFDACWRGADFEFACFDAALRQAIDPLELARMGTKAAGRVDGLGTSRVLAAMAELGTRP